MDFRKCTFSLLTAVALLLLAASFTPVSFAQPNGFVQVCKVAGSGVTVGTNFTFNVAGTQVIVAAGLAPDGSCGTPVTVPAGSAAITETIPANTLLAGVSTLPSAGLLVSSNLGAGTATVTVLAGGQTIVTFIDAAIPVVPTNGFVQVCKVAGSGVTVGTNFTFNVAGTQETVPAGLAPGGTCGTPVTVPAGPAVITETIPANTLVAGVSTLPSAGLLVSSNLAAGTATVTVVAGAQTIVTFIDAAIPVVPTNGFVQVCKVAGAGVTVGTNFAFNVAGTPVTVPAGLAPGGTCGAPVTVQAGSAVITETIAAGTLLAGVSTLPSAGLLVSSNLAAGTATVTVVAGAQTIVTFIDAAIPNGFVQVCKVAGAGVAVGTNFAFNVAGTQVTVAAGAAPGGTCGALVTVPAGPAVITETIPASTLVAGVSTLPSAGLLVSSNLAAGTATVTVVAGGQTIVTFIDATIPVVPTNGFVQVCKVAGSGVTVGTNFTFNVAGTQVIVPAGAAPGGTCGAPVTVSAGPAVVTETIPANTLVAGVSTLPSAGLLVSSNLAAGTATVTVVAGGQTIVTFIDAAIPGGENNGFVQVCKVAGAGVTVGTNFAFNVAGTQETVPAGIAPGGTCGAPVTVSAGPAVITETIAAGTLVAGVSTLPSAGLLVSSNLAAGTATVTVVAGGQTIVTFIDAAIPVVPTAPTISKAFGASNITMGGTIRLSFTITNPNAGASLSGIGFTDTLPGGLLVATPNGLTGSCGGGSIIATAGSGTVSLSGAALASGASCTFSVNVLGTSPGSPTNTTSTVTSAEAGAGGTASASITVLPPPVSTPVMSVPALAGFALLLAGLGWVLARKAERL